MSGTPSWGNIYNKYTRKCKEIEHTSSVGSGTIFSTSSLESEGLFSKFSVELPADVDAISKAKVFPSTWCELGFRGSGFLEASAAVKRVTAVSCVHLEKKKRKPLDFRNPMRQNSLKFFGLHSPTARKQFSMLAYLKMECCPSLLDASYKIFPTDVTFWKGIKKSKWENKSQYWFCNNLKSSISIPTVLPWHHTIVTHSSDTWNRFLWIWPQGQWRRTQKHGESLMLPYPSLIVYHWNTLFPLRGRKKIEEPANIHKTTSIVNQGK